MMNNVREFFAQPRWDENDTKSLRQIVEKEPRRAFPDEVWAMLTVDNTDLSKKKVLVPSSGNNFAVFAFSLLGASVTSTDFQQNVLDAAKSRASEYGLSNIEFRNVDTMTLNGLSDNEYDFIFTSNGVYNCLHDIQMTHNSFFRVLKPEGVYCFYENHPFYTLIDEDIDTSERSYRGTGKLCFAQERYKTIIEEDSIRNFHAIEDYVASLLDAGFIITDYSDIRRGKDTIPNMSGKTNIRYIIKPLLPSWIGIRAIKDPSR